jgi:hypothetical protein
MSSIELSAASLGCSATPLLEEEQYVRLDALISDVDHPLALDRPRLVTRLTSDDYPVNAVEIELAYGTNQWLDGQELGFGWRLP